MSNAGSTKPYVLRALYEWCCDNGFTPYLSVWVDENTQVPLQYVNNNEILLNIGINSCKDLNIDNQFVSFSARFSGVVHDVFVPVSNVLAIYSKETGVGMSFSFVDENLSDVPSLSGDEHNKIEKQNQSFGSSSALKNEKATSYSADKNFVESDGLMGFAQIQSKETQTKPNLVESDGLMGFAQIQSKETQTKPHFVGSNNTKPKHGNDDPDDSSPPPTGNSPNLRIVK